MRGDARASKNNGTGMVVCPSQKNMQPSNLNLNQISFKSATIIKDPSP